MATETLWTNAVIEIHRLHSEIMSHARMSLDKAIQIGELLTKVKDTLKHGQWNPWIEENLPFSRRTAFNYLFVFDKRAELKSANVALLSDAYALMLSKPNGNGNESPKLHEPNFHAQFVRVKQTGIGLFNHWIQRRPLRQWATEELFDTLASVEPFVAISESLKAELSTRPDAPRSR